MITPYEIEVATDEPLPAGHYTVEFWVGSCGLSPSKLAEEWFIVRCLKGEFLKEEYEKEPLCDFMKDLRETFKLIKGSWVNLLLVFVPFGVVAHFAKWNASVIFFLNFLGMIPLASILGDATECLADHLGETIGGLLNATFGNAVEVKFYSINLFIFIRFMHNILIVKLY